MTAERAFLLLRQSLTRRDSVSLDHQEARVREHCEREGYAVVGVSREESIRGWREDRSAVDAIRRLAAGQGFEVLVAYDLSRVARSVRLLENFIHDLGRAGIRFESATQEWVTNPLHRQIVAAFDEEQSRVIGRHVAGAAKVRAARGKTWGRPPFGYTRAGDELVPNPVTSVIVAGIFADWLSGVTVYQIGVRLIAQGIPPFAAMAFPDTSVRLILRNPAYCGDVALNGVVLAQDAHEAIIDRETWEAAQARFSGPRMRHAGDPRSWLEGHVLHACGTRMHLFLQQRGTGNSAHYPAGYPCFRCGNYNRSDRPCRQPRHNIGAPPLEEAVRQCLIADLADALDPQAAIRRQRQLSGSSAVQAERAKLTRDLKALADQRREAESLVLTRRRDVAWLDARDAEFRASEAIIQARLAALPSVPDGSALRDRWRDVVGFRRGLALADGGQLRRVLAAVGVAVVGEDGVSVRYGAGFRELVSESVTVVPQRVRR